MFAACFHDLPAPTAPISFQSKTEITRLPKSRKASVDLFFKTMTMTPYDRWLANISLPASAVGFNFHMCRCNISLHVCVHGFRCPSCYGPTLQRGDTRQIFRRCWWSWLRLWDRKTVFHSTPALSLWLVEAIGCPSLRFGFGNNPSRPRGAPGQQHQVVWLRCC